MALKSFRGKNIIITGGSAGIGLCLARELASRGANLTLIARGEERLQSAKKELEQYGGTVLVYSCDVADSERLEGCIGEARAKLGNIDGLIANSGYCHPGYFHEMAARDLYNQINTNLVGSVYAIHHAIPHLLDNGGGFIAITSSPAGNAGVFGFAAYGATKAALNNLSHALRAEYGRHNINIHLLLPPDTNTPGYKQEVLLYPNETRAILAGGRLFEPEVVARKFADGILKGKKQVTVSLEMHLLLFVVRHLPFIWECYVKLKARNPKSNREN